MTLIEFLLERVADQERTANLHRQMLHATPPVSPDLLEGMAHPDDLEAECEEWRAAIARHDGLLGVNMHRDLRVLALRWADRADYDPAWRP